MDAIGERNPAPWIARFLAGATSDLRHAARLLKKDRGFTSVTLLTLALCIGANTAIFSMVYALLLKPLPFRNPTRIVEIYNTFVKAGLNKMPSNLIQYEDYKAHTKSYEAIALCGISTMMFGEEGSAQRTTMAYGTVDFFDVLGVKPLIGQFPTIANSVWGQSNVIVLMQSFWEAHYHSDPGVLGTTVRIDGKPYTIIGVAPRSVEAFNARVKFFQPMDWKPEWINPQARFGLNTPLFGRLKEGVTVAQALPEAEALEKVYYDASPGPTKEFLNRAGHGMGIGVIQAERVKPIKSSLYLLQSGVIFVLLIGCLNVANLMLTRANGRMGELSIRFALGAGRTAIARQLLIESLLLTLSGAVLGVGLAWAGVRTVNHFTAKMLPDMLPITIDGSILAYTAALSVAVGLLMGIIPVIHVARSNLSAMIHRTSRSTSGGRGVRALSSLLVMVQVAVALMLLTGAGLLVHSFANMLSVRPGFDPDKVVVGTIGLPGAYGKPEAAAPLQRKLLQAIREIPGVGDAALSTGVPFQGNLPINALTLRESVLPRDAAQPGAFQVGASVGYFQALHIQLVEGRLFEDRDTLKGTEPYVVDEDFAKRYFPDRSAVGGHFTFGGPDKKQISDWGVIVGVVRSVPHNGLEDTSKIPFVYYPLLQRQPHAISIFVRSERPLADTIAAVREKVKSIDPTIPLFDTQPLQQVIDNSFTNRRAVMLLLGVFAGLALFLSAIGIYGVLAYDVSQRTREIGIRGAIGATRAQILGLVMRQGLWKTGVGLVAGLVGAILLCHYMAGMLYELKPTDPWAYAVVSVILAAVGAAASYLPARNAARINPNDALRIE
jgi:putative ABC transport system permease protein